MALLSNSPRPPHPKTSRPFNDQLFQLAFLVAVVAWLAFQSLFVQTTHIVIGERHIFRYGWVGIALFLSSFVIPIGAAWYLWRALRNRVLVGIILLMIPASVVLVMPQLVMERIEITPTHLIHRREPPHTRFNADIAFNEISAVLEIRHETGSFSTYHTSSYNLVLKDDRIIELPANTVLTAARDTIDAEFRRRAILIEVQTLRRQSK